MVGVNRLFHSQNSRIYGAAFGDEASRFSQRNWFWPANITRDTD
jgi:hypothetical protein